MSGASPGPWTAEPRENGAVVIRAGQKPVAEIWHNGDDPVATGRIVAVAPEMLSALRQMNAFAKKAATLDYNEDVTVTGIAFFTNYVDGLIAKAEGRS